MAERRRVQRGEGFAGQEAPPKSDSCGLRPFKSRLAFVLCSFLFSSACLGQTQPDHSEWFTAAKANNVAVLAKLLAAGEPINSQNAARRSALGEAVWAGGLGAVRFLLANGADPNVVGEGGNILQLAIKAHNREALELLLASKDIKVNARGVWNRPAIFTSVSEDEALQPDLFYLLLKHGADIDGTDDFGTTPLMYAAWYHQTKTVKFLVENGANIWAKNLDQETAYMSAAQRSHRDIMDYLAEYGAKVPVLLNRSRHVDPELTAKQRWALAVGAQTIQFNGESHELLSAEMNIPAEREKEIKSLKKGWDISSRQDLLNQLDRLRDYGHRAAFNQLGSLTDEQWSIVLQRLKTFPPGLREYSRDVYRLYGEKAILAWDLCRYVNLARWGYLAGYLTEDEAWQKIMPVARMIQGSFHDWNGMAQSYLLGRRYWQWSNEDEKKSFPDFENITTLLLNPRDPNSPWTKNPWNLDLW